MIILERRANTAVLEAKNCLVFDLPNGQRIRVWLQRRGSDGKTRCLIDAPDTVLIRRGEHIGADAEGLEL